MNKNSIYTIMLLTFIWIVLCEKFSAATVITGVIISTASVYFCCRYFPSYKIINVNFFILIIYPFYLIGQIYLSGLSAIKIILTAEKVEIVKVRTKIENTFLKVILANSITVTPGTISLELENDTITVLRLSENTENAQNADDLSESIKGGFEKILLKAQN